LLNPTSLITLLPTNYLILTCLPTETVLLYIHNHLINAIGSQKVSCLCFLDLSAAFDTIDRNLFGIHGCVLSWFKSYLSSCSFRVKCDNKLWSFHTFQPFTLHHVHYPSQCSDLFPFHWPPLLCRWHPAFLLFPLTLLWLTSILS